MQTAPKEGTRKLYECFLQGAVSNLNYGSLMERLQGVCGGEPQPIHFKEFIFKPSVTLPPRDATFSAPPHNELRVRLQLPTKSGKTQSPLW